MASIIEIYHRLCEHFSNDDLSWLNMRLGSYLMCDFSQGKTTNHLLCDELETATRVKKVVFNPPATIILWNDGSKSVVKAQNDEPFDPEKGFVMAYLKKLLGNDNTFNKEIAKWVKWEEPKMPKATFIPNNKPLTTEQIIKMNGEKLWVIGLDNNKVEHNKFSSNGWHTVNFLHGKLYDDDGGWYRIEDNDTECGFHAYLEQPKG